MYRNLSTILFLIFALGLFSVSTSAQIDASTPWGKPQEEPLPKNVQETLKKGELDQLKKEHEEMLENGQEAVKLSEEVEKAFNKNNKLSSADVEKLERIEKLLKKIRKELGGDDEDDETEDKPSSIKNAIETMKESAANLYDELKKTSRYSISVVAIQSSNSLINIVRFIRFWKK